MFLMKKWLCISAIPGFCLLVLCFIPFREVTAQTDVLSLRVSVRMDQTPVEEALGQIGRLGGFSFSYDASLIADSKRISCQVSRTKISDVLKLVLGDRIIPRQVGNHVILMNAPVGRVKKLKSGYTIQGRVTDALSGRPLHHATVYTVQNDIAVSSDTSGAFTLKLNTGGTKGISCSSMGYRDTVLFIDPVQESTIQIALEKSVPEVQTLESRKAVLGTRSPDTLSAGRPVIAGVEEIALVKLLVPRKSVRTAQNVQIYRKGSAQISLVLGVGTHGLACGSYSNGISFNVLAGYSRELNGVEVGGLVNIERMEVRGFQLGGLVNLAGGQTTGFQIGGLCNVNLGPVKGFQVAGVANWLSDTLKGFRLAGLGNITLGRMRGMDMAGLVNLAFHHVNGWQVAGFLNAGMYEVNQAQISGLVNYGRENWGFQMAGLLNLTIKENRGVQIAGLVNVAPQASRGVQIGGLLNYSRILNGFQLALFNIVGQVESGVPVGFLTVIRHGGYYRMEVSVDEVFYINAAFRAGTRHFYNIFKTGIGEGGMVNFTYGFGTLIGLGKTVGMGIDLTCGVVMSTGTGLRYHGMQGRLAPTVDITLTRKWTLFAGPALNLYWFNTGNTIMTDGIAPYTFYDHTFTTGPHRIQLWVGGIIGVKIF